MTTALFIGRFQPFHNAHLQDIKDILNAHDRIIIGIGSARKSRTTTNPYTYEERKEMIELVLMHEGIKEFDIFPVPDINNDDAWVSHVESIVGHYDVVYSGNDWVVDLFSQAKKRIIRIKLIPHVNSTTIRKLMDEQKRYEDLVPKKVAEYLKTINFKNRNVKSGLSRGVNHNGIRK